MARLLPTPDQKLPYSLRPSRHHLKGRRREKDTSKRFGLRDSKRPLSSSSGSDLKSIAVDSRNSPAESSSRSSILNDSRIEVLRSSVLMMPSAGMKLGHMLSLIHQDDVEFEQHESFAELQFSLIEGESRLMHPLPARRLRSLIAFAHHLDEVGPS